MAPSPLRLTDRMFFSIEHLRSYALCNTLSHERMGFVIYNCCWPSSAHSFSGPSPAGLITTFYSLTLETRPTWWPGPRIYIPQEHSGPVILPPGTGVPFRRLLRIAGLRWMWFEHSSTPWRASLLCLDAYILGGPNTIIA
jgi:hypothetical protein